jgi:hypothetical protein
MHGLMDALKSAVSYADRGTAIFERAAAILLQYPSPKPTPYFLGAPKGNNQRDTGLVNDLTRMLVPAFSPIAKRRQSQEHFWRRNSNGLAHHHA